MVWLLDGALQLQPFMLGKGFAEQVVAPTAAGQPAFVAAAVRWAAAVIVAHPVAWDALFAAVQLVIGAGLLARRTVRPALLLSFVWAGGVWYFGEGLGGLFGGTATFAAGAPGAVALYVVIGMAAWPRLGPRHRDALFERGVGVRARLRAVTSPVADEGPARWVPAAWALTWSLFAILQALPANDTSGALGSQLAATASSAPSWLASAERFIASWLGHQGWAPVAGIVVAQLAIGLLVLRGGRTRVLAAGAGIVVALGVWVVGQAFGQIATGMGTDPNSGLLVALLGLGVLGARGPVPGRADRGIRPFTGAHRALPDAPRVVA